MTRLNETYFEKVSFEQFRKDWLNTFHKNLGEVPKATEEMIKTFYNDLKPPMRATQGSAGYDFHSPFTISLHAGQVITIPTGYRMHINEGYFLEISPRSGHGFKYGIQLANTCGIIDSDYYYSDNEGHIFVKIANCNPVLAQTLKIGKGEAFCQGIILQFCVTADDDATDVRNGGLGSTSA